MRGDQRAGDGALYTRRASSDTNEGRIAAASCPCLVLMVIFDDETFDGDLIRHMMCPSCAAGWVREVSPPKDERPALKSVPEGRLDGSF